MIRESRCSYVRMVHDVSDHRSDCRRFRFYRNRFGSGGDCEAPVRRLLDSLRPLAPFRQTEYQITKFPKKQRKFDPTVRSTGRFFSVPKYAIKSGWTVIEMKREREMIRMAREVVIVKAVQYANRQEKWNA